MIEDPHLQSFLETCQRMYLRMLRDGTWPWADSTESEDLVESEDQSDDVV